MNLMDNKLVQTTKGLLDIKATDRILVHEHIFNRYPFRQQRKMEEYVLCELDHAYKQGISVICDLTAYTKPYNYYNIIERSPVNIVSCLGFYTPRYVPAQLRNQDLKAILRSYSKIIENGIGTRKIKPGILKIAAQSQELTPVEHKFFKVIAQLSREYNLPVALHAPKGALTHSCSLISEGVRPNKLFVAHTETNISKESAYQKQLYNAIKILELGAYVQLADFGCTLSSKKRCAGKLFVKELIEQGFIHQILLSADSCWRWKNGEFVVKEYNLGDGKHYTYTKDFSLPLLQEEFPTIDLEQILLCDNPKRLFS